MNKSEILLDYAVFDKELNSIELANRKRYVINTINPHSYVVSKADSKFKKALKTSDILLPDGIGIVKAIKFLNKSNINKIAGADLHEHLLKYLNDINGSAFYLGASEDTLKKISDKIGLKYPNIIVNSYSPPYKQKFNEVDNQLMIDKINKVQPDVLFVGMTAPKQEKWVYENKDKLNVGIITCIGAVFDFYAGTVIRPSKFWIDLGLEWLPRLLKEPKRLWRRNLISTPLFAIDVFKEKINL